MTKFCNCKQDLAPLGGTFAERVKGLFVPMMTAYFDKRVLNNGISFVIGILEKSETGGIQ
jgi:hypothetical protein